MPNDNLLWYNESIDKAIVAFKCKKRKKLKGL